MKSAIKKKNKLKMDIDFEPDQTPTPTRFIRNCEEVGLFQDLQNVNPFEETFRKAVESGKANSTSVQNGRLSSQLTADDTLHTPHIFPHINEHDSNPKPESFVVNKTSTEDPSSVKNPRPAVSVVYHHPQPPPLRKIAPCSTRALEERQPVQLILEMPDGRLMQLNATSLGSVQNSNDLLDSVDRNKLEMGNVSVHSGQKKKTDSDISPLIKERLKARLGSTGADRITNKSPQSRDIAGGQNEEGELKKQLSFSSATSNSDDGAEERRRKFLERNRAAAMRCREKRKCWVATLESQAEQLVAQNQQLLFDLGAVRAENAQLKSMLLAHKNCSVSQSINNNSIGSMGIEPLLIKPERVIKSLTSQETEFRLKLKQKLKRASNNKQEPSKTVRGNGKIDSLKVKRLSLDIESANQARCPIIRDSFLSSVATQVIQVNPNVMNRRLSSPNIEGPLLPISPSSDSLDYN